MKRIKNGWLRRRTERGAAAVEMAIVTPLLILICFGIIEFGWMFTVKNTMLNAVREGARTGSLQGSTYSDIKLRVDDFLGPINLAGKVNYDIVEASSEDPIVSVSLSIPASEVSVVGNYFAWVLTGDVTATASMRKEGI